MSIFKNIFGNKNKEEKKGDEKVLFESNIKRDILNDLEADKVIAELENERKLKELENQIKLKELEIENKIKLNKKFSDDIKEVYINQSEYFSNMKIVFGRLKSYYNDFGIKITEDDIINIFVFDSIYPKIMQQRRELKLEQLEQAVNMLKAIAHPMRISIISLLEDGRKMTVTEIHEKLQIEQSTTSHHLGILKDKGVLSSKREGKNTLYFLRNENLGRILDCIGECTV